MLPHLSVFSIDHSACRTCEQSVRWTSGLWMGSGILNAGQSMYNKTAGLEMKLDTLIRHTLIIESYSMDVISLELRSRGLQ